MKTNILNKMGFLKKKKQKTEIEDVNNVILNGNCVSVNNISGKSTTNTVTKLSSGWYTDNFYTYYLDENGVKNYSE